MVSDKDNYIDEIIAKCSQSFSVYEIDNQLIVNIS